MTHSEEEYGSLLDENERLRAALESSIAGLLVFDQNHLIRFINEAFLDIIGYKILPLC